MNTDPLLVDARTAATMLGISERSLWTIAYRGGIPSVKIGARRLYSVESLRRWITEREASTTRLGERTNERVGR